MHRKHSTLMYLPFVKRKRLTRTVVAWGATGVLLAVLGGCFKSDLLFPVEPEIQNLRATVVKDAGQDNSYTVTLEFEYQDGDGDIGTNNPEPGSENFELTDIRENVTWPVLTSCFFKDSVEAGEAGVVCISNGQVLIDTVFAEEALTPGLQLAQLQDSISRFTLPDLSNDQRIPSISGTITFTNILVTRLPEAQPGIPLPPPPSTQSIRYRIRIQDRAGNWSNAIESNTVVLD